MKKNVWIIKVWIKRCLNFNVLNINGENFWLETNRERIIRRGSYSIEKNLFYFAKNRRKYNLNFFLLFSLISFLVLGCSVCKVLNNIRQFLLWSIFFSIHNFSTRRVTQMLSLFAAAWVSGWIKWTIIITQQIGNTTWNIFFFWCWLNLLFGLPIF